MESLENQDIIPLEKAKKTPKPRSEKQMEHFKNLQQKRKENIEKKKLEKKIEASKLLLEHGQLRGLGAEAPEIITSPPSITPKKKQKTQGTGYQELSSPPSSDEGRHRRLEADASEEESDSSVEKVIVNVKNKNKKKPKKKTKEIIIYNDDSESEEEEGGYEIIEPKRVLKTQQNKKTKIYQQERELPLSETKGLQPQIFKGSSTNTDLLFC
jgi:hypothetical protein